MGDIRAANIERPGDILRIRYEKSVGSQLFQLGANALELAVRSFAGELDLAQCHRADWRSGAVSPERINRVAVGRNQFRSRNRASPFKLFSLVTVCSQGS